MVPYCTDDQVGYAAKQRFSWQSGRMVHNGTRIRYSGNLSHMQMLMER